MHFPGTYDWTYWHTPWYVGQAALAKINFILYNILPWLDEWWKTYKLAMHEHKGCLHNLSLMDICMQNGWVFAAKGDRSSKFRICWHIALPLTKPILAMVVVFNMLNV